MAGTPSNINKKRKRDIVQELPDEIDKFWNDDSGYDPEPAPEDPEPLPPQPEWKLAADSVLEQVCKHPFVDRTKPATVVFDFISPIPLQPIVVTEPSDSSGKKKAGKKRETVVQDPPPLDLTTLLHRLETFTIVDAEEFFDMLVGVFDNALQAMLKRESAVLKHLVKRLEQLIVYVKWLSLEMLPLSVTDDGPAQSGITSSSSSSSSCITIHLYYYCVLCVHFLFSCSRFEINRCA